MVTFKQSAAAILMAGIALPLGATDARAEDYQPGDFLCATFGGAGSGPWAIHCLDQYAVNHFGSVSFARNASGRHSVKIRVWNDSSCNGDASCDVTVNGREFGDVWEWTPIDYTTSTAPLNATMICFCR